jgi:hypothetical protein
MTTILTLFVSCASTNLSLAARHTVLLLVRISDYDVSYVDATNVHSFSCRYAHMLLVRSADVAGILAETETRTLKEHREFLQKVLGMQIHLSTPVSDTLTLWCVFRFLINTIPVCW